MNKLIPIARRALNEKWGYVWGAQGELLTPQLLQRFKDTFGAKHYVFADSDGTMVDAAKWIGSRVADCSGLFVFGLRELGLIPKDADFTAADLYGKCKDVKAGELQEGDLVFRKNAAGEIVHVGIYIGNGQVIEAKGTRYGVVIGAISNFNLYGRLQIKGVYEMEKEDYKQILKNVSDSPERWEKAINTAVSAAKADGNLGDLEILGFLPTLIEKIADYYKKQIDEV